MIVIRYPFIKMHSVGNDYVFIDCFETEVDEPHKLAKDLSNRRISIGSDGLILIMPSEYQDCKMRIFNSDGSEGIMCGNGVRCAGYYMYRKMGQKKNVITVETKGGIKEITISDDEVVAAMGTAEFTPESIGFRGKLIRQDVEKYPGELIEKTMFIDGRRYMFSGVSMGNPHCVFFLASIPADIQKVSKIIEKSGVFENGINIHFVHFVNDEAVEARVYERGSGETYGCGTGACAIISAAVRAGRFKKDKWYKVIYPGGTLNVCVKADLQVLLKSSVHTAFEGVAYV